MPSTKRSSQEKKVKEDEAINLFSQSWYNTLRYQVVPPLFIVIFTAAVQWLGLLGGVPCPLDLTQCERLAGNSFSWTVVASFIIWVFIWLLIPAKQFIGPESPEGENPVYQDNGMLFYFATIVAFFLSQIIWPWLSHELVTNFSEVLASLSLFALVLCIWLVIKARVQGKESGMPLVYDFYRGSELHPHILGCDAKQLTVSRIGIMGWQLLIIAGFLDSQLTAADIATLTMHTVYIIKFFWWESGYYTTLDITYDRAGYYLCWGGMVWIPALFPISQLYVAQYSSTMSNTMSIATTILALSATLLEYDIDRQKEVFVEWRQKYVKGEAKPYNIWGKTVKFIEASYVNTNGETRRSALLAGGYWGLARHANYTCELLVSFLWCIPSAAGHIKFIPMLYFYFIAGLIAHRILRDEDKCSSKYGKYWQKYCNAVPYRFIPYIF